MAANIRPTPESYYYSGQGRLGIGVRDTATGRFDEMLFVGNVTSVAIDIAVQKFEHKESMTGKRSIDLTVIQEQNATFKITAESLNLDLMALSLYGAQATVAGGSVTGESHAIKKGQAFPLRYPKVSAITVTGLTSGEYDYDADFGTIYVHDDASPADGTVVTVDYTYAGHSKLEAFTQGTAPERYLRFEGLNTVDGSFRIIEIPRGSFEPMTGMELINEELGSGEISGTILPDLTIVTPGLSQYFRELRAA